MDRLGQKSAEAGYLLVLVRYTHLNTVRAKVVKTMKELDDYSWNKHRMVLEKGEYAWIGPAPAQIEKLIEK